MDLDFYRFPATTDEIIKREISIEFLPALCDIWETMTKEQKKANDWPKERDELYEKWEIREQELYKNLYEGRIDLDEINRRYSIYVECKNYCDLWNWYEFNENYPFNNKLAQKMMEMSYYTSFGE